MAVELTLLNSTYFMNGKKTTTRKGFFKWTGLAFIGGFALSGKSILRKKASPVEAGTTQLNSLPAMSRVRPAKEVVVYKSA